MNYNNIMKQCFFIVVWIAFPLLLSSATVQDTQHLPGKAPDVCWYVHSELAGLSLQKISMASKKNGWIGIENAELSSNVILSYTDDTWKGQDNFPRKSIRAHYLDAVSDRSVWQIDFKAGYDNVYETLRINHFNGESWTTYHASPGLWPQCIDMIDDTEGWIGGNSGFFLHYKNGVWQREFLITPDTQTQRGLHIFSIKMLNPHEGWATGDGHLSFYNGTTWTMVPLPKEIQNVRFYDLDVTESGIVYMVGHKGLIVTYDGQNFTLAEPVVNEELRGIHMTSDTDGWIVGHNGVILRYDGKTWHKQTSPIEVNLYDIQMLSPTEGWICGNGIILKSANFSGNIFKYVQTNKNRIMNLQETTQCAAVDIDNDYDEDIFFLQNQRLFRNNGQGNFLDISDTATLSPNDDDVYQAFAWGDVDNDTDLDLFLLGINTGTHKLLLNNGKGRFYDFTKKSGITCGNVRDTGTCYFVDIDLDHDLDLYISGIESYEAQKQENHIYINDGAGRFILSDTHVPDRISHEFFVLWADIDGDMFPEPVIPLDDNRTIMYHNDRGSLIRDKTKSDFEIPVIASPTQGHLFDADLDGDMDKLLLLDALYLFYNDGQGTYDTHHVFEHTENNLMNATTLTALGDINNDGYTDILVQTKYDGTNTLRLFIARENGTYEDIAPYIGLHKYSGKNALFNDFDNDGDLDLYITRGSNDKNIYLENRTNNDAYLKLALHGIISNARGMGAKVAVYEAGYFGDSTYLRGSVQTGLGNNPRSQSNTGLLHFGLSPAKKYDIGVTFAGGRTVILKGIQTGKTIHIYEYPVIIRHLLILFLTIWRGYHQANIFVELLKLWLIILLIYLAAKRTQGRIKKIYGTPASFIFYLFINGLFARSHFWYYHIRVILIFIVVMVILMILDKILTIWKSSRYLGHYRLIAKIGEGGMGKVFKAKNIISRKTVAIKILNPEITGNEINKLRFIREAKVMEKLRHPHIVSILETGQLNGKGFFSMELLQGAPLSELISRGERLPLPKLFTMLVQICDALTFIHNNGIIHRDIKSDNIFIVDKNNSQDVKLMDFGLSRSREMMTITRSESLLGTIPYMPPEVISGGYADVRSDIYSLGVVIYEGLTGTLPFHGDNEISTIHAIIHASPLPPGKYLPGIDKNIEGLVMKMMSKKREDRYHDMEEVKSALHTIILTVPGLSGETLPAMSRRDISPADNPLHGDNSKEFYYAGYRAAHSSGDKKEARDYIDKAYSMLTDEKKLLRTHVDKEIFINHTIGELTRKWGRLYHEAKTYRDEQKVLDADFKIKTCITIINELLLILPDHEKERYITEHNVGKVLHFARTLNQ